VKPGVVAEAKAVVAMMPFPSSTLLCPERYLSAHFCVLETVVVSKGEQGLGNGPRGSSRAAPISVSDMDEQKVITSGSDQRPTIAPACMSWTNKTVRGHTSDAISPETNAPTRIGFGSRLSFGHIRDVEVSLKQACLHP
jgi:hypothetical protein